MLRNMKWVAVMAFCVTAILGFTGCSDFGQVDQGRVIEYNKDTQTVTIISDKNIDPQKPDFSKLPPVTFRLPVLKDEMGPEPKAGKRMKLDLEKKEIVIYVPQLKNFATIKINVIENRDKIPSTDPLVFDNTAGKVKSFPIIDQAKKTITIYSARQKTLTTFSVPDEYYIMPPETWDAGDVLRIYYKQAGQAIRCMNVTKTDIFKK